ncbi:iron complex transport system permease protein [Pseudorhizobium tarimense]|uniref:Iron complex transport system permease protein n=1 Tax=Pseudorhizobium tarimense TaxID=1079109 RepID=A0ABV2HBH4_9HYPH|nr:ABC transporter permease [Pseudorhizobium tarimense]MCJ8520949.1 ABC transporter permease [Pseudorhizobium tarimense]
MKLFVIALLATTALAVASLFVGVSEISFFALLSGESNEKMLLVLGESRIPRTAALILAGAGMAVAGTIMQLLSRNRFVEPSTAGTVESASLGMLAVLLLAPDLPVMMKMLVAALFALAGTALFLGILRRVPLRSPVLVPLVGLMLGGVINACTTFFAYRYDLMQAMGAWTSGDFSAVLRGRYEVLWLALALTAAAYFAADRFTVAGMGKDFSTNLGLDYRKVVALGLLIVSMVTASVVVTAGILPFIGLIVPNLVSMAMGDRLRHTLPWVALSGAVLVLLCDTIGRVINAPYEIPVGSMLGIIGSIFFLSMLLRRRSRAA